MKRAREKQGKLSNIQSILEQGFYLLVELGKRAMRPIAKLLFICRYNLKLPPQSTRTHRACGLPQPPVPAALALDLGCVPFPFPMAHGAFSPHSQRSSRSLGSAVATRPCRCPFFPLPMQTARHFLGSLLCKARHSREVMLSV